MNIIQEWYGSSGLLCRFYMVTDNNGAKHYFVDTKFGAVSTELRIIRQPVVNSQSKGCKSAPVRYLVEGVENRVPDKYIRWITAWFVRQEAVGNRQV